MPGTKPVKVKNLRLDLVNFRTVRQDNEQEAVEAMISTSPDRFWALAESLLDDGYLPTETIIVLADGAKRPKLTVREGNRRIAALKLILGHLKLPPSTIPENIKAGIKARTPEWKAENSSVPCAIYPSGQAATVDKIVTLAHGKGEKAGRDQWNAVARARHNRDFNQNAEPALDLLEKYFQKGRNVTDAQKSRWSGAYPVTVLEEVMKRYATRFGVGNSRELAPKYPDVQHRDVLENVIRDIGLEQLRFEGVRSAAFGATYGLPDVTPQPQAGATAKQPPPGKAAGPTPGAAAAGTPPQSPAAAPTPPTPTPTPAKVKAVATTDPRAVRRRLKDFEPKGKRREKVVDLRNEAAQLDLSKTPMAFCFVLRSMFEISAKAYCADHTAAALTMTKADGTDRKLVEVLRDITAHLTKNKTDKAMMKILHGALTELAKADGLLSVTSMNQLVHNPQFSIAPGDLAILFSNVFPLLEAMNS